MKFREFIISLLLVTTLNACAKKLLASYGICPLGLSGHLGGNKSFCPLLLPADPIET